jgi:cytochrome c oxidase subunit IV
MPFSRKRGDSNPSQAVRLIWFHLFFLSPMAAIAYVATYELKDAGQDALIRVLFILAVSLIVSLFCAIAQPIQIIDESLMTNAGRANLCLAVVDTIIVEDANDLAG